MASPRTQNEGIAAAPTFTPHRVNVVAADAAPPSPTTQKSAHGLSSDGWEEIAAQVDFTGAGPVAVQMLLWNDLEGAFVSSTPAVTTSFAAPSVGYFSPKGQRFFLHLTGTFTRADVSVAGTKPSGI